MTEPTDATERNWRSDYFANQDHPRHFRSLIVNVRGEGGICLELIGTVQFRL